MHVNIDYMAPNGAPDNDRKMKEASWLTGQAFIESLRYYPKGTQALENNGTHPRTPRPARGPARGPPCG